MTNGTESENVLYDTELAKQYAEYVTEQLKQ